MGAAGRFRRLLSAYYRRRSERNRKQLAAGLLFVLIAASAMTALLHMRQTWRATWASAELEAVFLAHHDETLPHLFRNSGFTIFAGGRNRK